MPYYYNPYGYGVPNTLLLYDIPLFLLFFSLIYIVVRFVVKIPDKIVGNVSAVFAAAVAYFIVRSHAEMYTWFLWHWQAFYGIVVLVIIGGLIYFLIKIK